MNAPQANRIPLLPLVMLLSASCSSSPTPAEPTATTTARPSSSTSVEPTATTTASPSSPTPVEPTPTTTARPAEAAPAESLATCTERPAPSARLLVDAFAAKRLARAIASDIVLYNEPAIKKARVDGVLPEELREAIKEGFELYCARVSPEHAALYKPAVDDIILRIIPSPKAQ